jgi:hypothetical protein
MAGEVAYTTRERMYQLALSREAFKGVPTVDQDAAILAESSVLDLSLVRFKPPLTSWPLAVERIVAVRAAYRLMRRGYLDPAFTSTLKEDFDEVTAQMNAIAEGKLGLGALATDTTPNAREMGAKSWGEDSRGWTAGGIIP